MVSLPLHTIDFCTDQRTIKIKFQQTYISLHVVLYSSYGDKYTKTKSEWFLLTRHRLCKCWDRKTEILEQFCIAVTPITHHISRWTIVGHKLLSSMDSKKSIAIGLKHYYFFQELQTNEPATPTHIMSYIDIHWYYPRVTHIHHQLFVIMYLSMTNWVI